MNFPFLTIETIVILGICSGVASITITRMNIFEWFRNLVVNLANIISEKLASFFDEFVHCHYCIGHWTSLFFMLLAVKIDGPAHFIISWFSIVAVSVLFSSTVIFLMEKANKE